MAELGEKVVYWMGKSIHELDREELEEAFTYCANRIKELEQRETDLLKKQVQLWRRN